MNPMLNHIVQKSKVILISIETKVGIAKNKISIFREMRKKIETQNITRSKIVKKIVG